jgi:hypothetical protein
MLDQHPDILVVERRFPTGEHDSLDSGSTSLVEIPFGPWDTHRPTIIRPTAENAVVTGQIAGERIGEMKSRVNAVAFDVWKHRSFRVASEA